MEVIAIEGVTLALLVSFGLSIRNQRACRAIRLALGYLPVETILLSGLAPEPLCIDSGRIVVVSCRRIVHLRLTKRLGDLDGCEFVGPNAAIEQLLHSFGGVESPRSVVPHDRDRERPLILADQQGPLAGAGRYQTVMSVVETQKVRAIARVLRVITGRNKAGSIRPQDLLERGNVVASVSRDQLIYCLLRGSECFLRSLLRTRRNGEQQARRHQQEENRC